LPDFLLDDIIQILDDKKFKVFPSINCSKQLKFQKVKVECVFEVLQNAKKITFHQGLDHLNSPKVPCNG
jgi:hypothetical protein